MKRNQIKLFCCTNINVSISLSTWRSQSPESLFHSQVASPLFEGLLSFVFSWSQKKVYGFLINTPHKRNHAPKERRAVNLVFFFFYLVFSLILILNIIVGTRSSGNKENGCCDERENGWSGAVYSNGDNGGLYHSIDNIGENMLNRRDEPFYICSLHQCSWLSLVTPFFLSFSPWGKVCLYILYFLCVCVYILINSRYLGMATGQIQCGLCPPCSCQCLLCLFLIAEHNSLSSPFHSSCVYFSWV